MKQGKHSESAERLRKGLYASDGPAQRRIDFVPARRPDAHSAGGDLGLTPLNDPILLTGSMPSKMGGKNALKASGGVMKKRPAELYREGDLKMTWDKVARIGAGLKNLGNTCFLNSVLQCLTYTPPLAQFCLNEGYKPRGQGGFDALALLQSHIHRAINAPQRVVSPAAIVKSLKQLSRSFRMGRQEDSHEFMRCLLDACQQSCVKGLPKGIPPALAETSFVSRAFGGRLRSQVKCMSCKYESNTFDPFLDLSLEINKASTLNKALQAFTIQEVLDGDNKYKCDKCKRKVRAIKQFTINKAPNVLTVQLKRFSFFGGKINKKVEYPTRLTLDSFMSEGQQGKEARHVYNLYGVLVHMGGGVHSGHYYCYCKSPMGTWYEMDDSQVQPVSERQVLTQNAYVLFY
eukprot:CAMPEP_0182895866 /NCGR_PEP_ID=MMETSP0034_2-20130328/25936_1 /TAXON_ID=156128 /ORGANISM="Nephroselmis pyriformis, Strain CCMP717" /LENGTH=402 /DNA_ID=CAMNT_0025029715 /DNA_START=59 /DNA_END=1264 /DNA_ORIENTATION=+